MQHQRSGARDRTARALSRNSSRLSDWAIRLVGLLLLVFALAIGLFKAPDRPVETLVARWAPPPSELIELKVGGHTQLTHLRDEGPRTDPLPLVLFHGTSDSLHTWDGWARELSKTRRVIRADLPGFGLTGPATDGDHGIRAYVAFATALMDHLKVRRAVLVGNSLGGEVAWMTAATHPERVAALVLVDPSGLPFTPEHVPIGFLLSANPVTGWLSQYLLPRSLVQQSVEGVFGNPQRVNQDTVDRFYEISLREGNRAALGDRIDTLLKETKAGFHTAEWAKVKAPTLLLWGERDRLIPPATAQAYLKGRAAGAPAPELKILPTLGHVPQLEDPVTSLAAARAFIDAAR